MAKTEGVGARQRLVPDHPSRVQPRPGRVFRVVWPGTPARLCSPLDARFHGLGHAAAIRGVWLPVLECPDGEAGRARNLPNFATLGVPLALRHQPDVQAWPTTARVNV